MKLLKILSFKGKVECITGLHIGGTNNQIKIGGVDSEIIRNPITDEPYIPGSSLKGKMRSQLEKKLGLIKDDGKPCRCGLKDCMVCKIFGAHMNTRSECGSTRIIVRDSNLSEETRAQYKELILEKGASFIETKTENIINRKSGTSDNPRVLERIPAGSLFDFNIQLNIFDGDDEKELVEAVQQSLKLVEDSYLGGSGSRGYGQVKFIYGEVKEA